MFWIWNANVVDNSLMFWFLPGCVYPKSRTSLPLSVSCSANEEEHKRNWEGPYLGQVTQTNQRDIPHHRMPCPVYKLGGLPGRVADLGLGMWVWNHSVGSEQLH